jgi:hypothetical protein
MIPASDGNCRLPGPATRQLFQVATLPLSSPKGTMRLEVEPKMASSKSAPQKRKDAFGGLSEVSRREEICRLPAVVQCCRFSIPSFHRGLAKLPCNSGSDQLGPVLDDICPIQRPTLKKRTFFGPNSSARGLDRYLLTYRLT